MRAISCDIQNQRMLKQLQMKEQQTNCEMLSKTFLISADKLLMAQLKTNNVLMKPTLAFSAKGSFIIGEFDYCFYDIHK